MTYKEQPRHPAGSDKGGEWSKMSGGGSSTDWRRMVEAPGGHKKWYDAKGNPKYTDDKGNSWDILKPYKKSEPKPKKTEYKLPSEEDTDAVLKYQWDSANLNNGLRAGWDPGDNTKLVERLDRATALNDVKEEVLYRGMELGTIKFSEGDVLEDKGFLSTTKSARSAQEFIEGSSDKGAVIFKIRIPRGTKGADMNAITTALGQDNPYSDQEEVLLGRGSKMRVDRITKNRDGVKEVHVTMEG